MTGILAEPISDEEIEFFNNLFQESNLQNTTSEIPNATWSWADNDIQGQVENAGHSPMQSSYPAGKFI